MRVEMIQIAMQAICHPRRGEGAGRAMPSNDATSRLGLPGNRARRGQVTA